MSRTVWQLSLLCLLLSINLFKVSQQLPHKHQTMIELIGVENHLQRGICSSKALQIVFFSLDYVWLENLIFRVFLVFASFLMLE